MLNKQKDIEQQEVNYKQFDLNAANNVAKKLRELRKEKFESTKKFKIECQLQNVPSTYDSMINFERILYKSTDSKRKQSVKGMRLATFYELCLFYNVSPNYLLYDNASRHIEDTADKIKADWGITDDILNIFKFAARHSYIGMGNINEMEFLSLILKECFLKIEMITEDYLIEQKRINDFRDKYFINGTDFLKDEYMSEEAPLIDEYHEYQSKAMLYRVEILKIIENFLGNLYKKVYD